MNSQTETPMMKCDWCNREFPADARACVEGGISSLHEIPEGDEWKGESYQDHAPELSTQDRESVKAEFGLDDAQLEELLTTGSVSGIGVIVCLECQDSALTELPE